VEGPPAVDGRVEAGHRQLRAYGQKDPLVEYKKESYELFTAMMDRIEDETVRYLYFLQVRLIARRINRCWR
jgi:preprotein translocase subunit SecA